MLSLAFFILELSLPDSGGYLSFYAPTTPLPFLSSLAFSVEDSSDIMEVDIG